jgi:hypothetical protein
MSEGILERGYAEGRLWKHNIDDFGNEPRFSGRGKDSCQLASEFVRFMSSI